MIRRERFSAILRSRVASPGWGVPAGGSTRISVAPAEPPKTLEDILPGEVLRVSGGTAWIHRNSFYNKALAHRSRLAVRHFLPGSSGPIRVFDLETCGFSGTPLFLAGFLEIGAEALHLTQFFARHYGEEAAAVEASLRKITPPCTIVSFNGKSYDIPFLRDRASRFGLPCPETRTHLDVLHLARRQWRRDLPDCRLTTLEREILGRRRHGDVPGSQVPERYHRYVRMGDPRILAPVFRHNRMDLLALGELASAARL